MIVYFRSKTDFSQLPSEAKSGSDHP